MGASILYFFFGGAFYSDKIAYIIDDRGGNGDAQHQKEHIDKPAAGYNTNSCIPPRFCKAKQGDFPKNAAYRPL